MNLNHDLGNSSHLTGSGKSSTSESPFRVWPGDGHAFSLARISPLRHNFHNHPLMQLDRIAKLASSLMATGQCRFIAPGTTQASRFHHEPKNAAGLSIDEVFRRIEESGSWVALYNVETDPAYRGFIHEVIASVRPFIERDEGAALLAQGFMFISAPPSVTPFHIDRENNFWLQIRGRKIINVWSPVDRETVSAVDVEDFVAGRSLTGVKLRQDAIPRSHQFDTGPGDGVYFPSTSPHMTRSEVNWVKPGDGVSISIGIVFYTPLTRQRANIHFLNKKLRRLGLSPTPPGISPWLDRAKYPIGKSMVTLARLLRGYIPPPGF